MDQWVSQDTNCCIAVYDLLSPNHFLGSDTSLEVVWGRRGTQGERERERERERDSDANSFLT
jgi:hypothetical protein